jgi:hypothetical protein
MENHNTRNIIIGLTAGAAAGAAIGYVIGRKTTAECDTENELPTRKRILGDLADVALEKGIEALYELKQKYTHPHTGEAA